MDEGRGQPQRRTLRTLELEAIRERGRFFPKATAFFVSYFQDDYQFDHLVTAEHVVSGLLTKGHEIWLRVNLHGGGVAEVALEAHEFRFHPEAEIDPTDVAVIPFKGDLTGSDGSCASADYRTIPINGPLSLAASDSWLTEAIGPGSEISIIGLFRSHFGTNRNIPVVRLGHISAMPTEPIRSNYGGPIEAYLVEARSIAGLSGSPVFGWISESVTLAAALSRKKPPRTFGLIGLIHGHFDLTNLNEDVVAEHIDESSQGIHTGMGVVIPFRKIMETIEQPELTDLRIQRALELKKERR